MGLLILLELYYCCYYPESDAFRDRVASIANLFREKGYDVIMDAMVSSEISSQGPTRWAETQIRRASKVLVFLSPGLLRLAADGCEGLHSQVAFIVTKYVINPRSKRSNKLYNTWTRVPNVYSAKPINMLETKSFWAKLTECRRGGGLVTCKV